MPNIAKENTVTTTTVSAHWMHQRFVQNLLNASHERDLRNAAKEWRFSSLHVSGKSLQCQLCNTCINKCVTLHNTVNGNYLVLGENCYDKLLGYLKSGRVKSALPSRDAQTKKLRQHWKGLLKKLKDRTVVGWFRDELQDGRLPADIAEIVYTISRIGLAPTTEDADRIIAYYKATRRFPINALVRWQELLDVQHRNLLPTMITIGQIDRVKRILARGRELYTQRCQMRYEATERRQLNGWISSSLKKLTTLRDRLQTASQNGITRAARAQAEVERILVELSASIEKTHDLVTLRKTESWILHTVNQTCDNLQWKEKEPEKILLVMRGRRQYILVKRNNRWQRLSSIMITSSMRHYPDTGVYSGIVLDHETPVKVNPLEELDLAQELPSLEFSVPSQKVPGTFVAMMNGKIVLPSWSIRKPGTYFAFIMNDAGRYYRAWVL